MKRTINFIVFTFVLAALFTSCRKDYTCKCTSADNSTTGISYMKSTQKRAEKSCERDDRNWKTTGLGGGCKLL